MKHIVISFLFFIDFHVFSQNLDSELVKFAPFIQALENFSKNIPQEKVYLHFDNTSYYQGDTIWFKCYIVTTGQHQLSPWSKTLYVELLNPGGEIVDKRILKIENGQCHGDFTLNDFRFYSGFYEVRAYTKYMLNFGDDVIFSRLLPVFDKPELEGNFEEKNMMRYDIWGTGNFPMVRERPLRENRVNLRFFPEGGNLIQGVASRVAFEVTDETGNPIDVTGVVMNAEKQELCSITSLYEGRGVFMYTPGDSSDRRKDIVVIEYSGRKYQFDLPAGLPHGVVMDVDNLTHPGSIGVTLRKNRDTPAEMSGMVVLSGGIMRHYQFIWMNDDQISFKIDKTKIPAGVSQIVLFNSTGEILSDRLIFTNKNEFLNITAKTGKPVYQPHELVNMELSVADWRANPVQTTFSLSVRDGTNEVESGHNILTNLLLMSEIKGYVRNPFYYFEEKNDTVETLRTTSLHLDLLLMVQGWRRYSWKQMVGIATGHTPSLQIKYSPEQGIETQGKVVSVSLRGKQTPKPKVDVGLLLQKRENENEPNSSLIENFVTDDQGCFSFSSDVDGRWSMILTASENGKRRNYMILLDRIFSPKPRRYNFADLQTSIAENKIEIMADEETPDDFEEEKLDLTFRNSPANMNITEQIQLLSEVTTTARGNPRDQDILFSRSTSIACYDVASENDNMYDKGQFAGNDIHKMLVKMNKDFYVQMVEGIEYLYYKGKITLFVINYERTEWSDSEYFKYKSIELNAIKSIYVNDNLPVICKYSDPKIPCFKDNHKLKTSVQEMFGCVVFIETCPDGQIPVESGKGVRKTWLEGYSPVKEFYSPNYSELPPAPDYRRTLYWNPMVKSDKNGNAKINFYNNSRSTSFSISAETVIPLGIIGIYKKE